MPFYSTVGPAVLNRSNDIVVFSNKILSNSTRSLLPKKRAPTGRRPNTCFYFRFFPPPVVYVFCTRGQTRFIRDLPPVIAGNQCRFERYITHEDDSTSPVTDIFQKFIVNISYNAAGVFARYCAQNRFRVHT